jgi:hypothetical protein
MGKGEVNIMKTTLILSLMTLFSMTANATQINILHFNIKELTTEKLNNKDKQLEYVKNITDKFNADIFSVNELQYDLPKVPLLSNTSNGQNLKKLNNLLGLELDNSTFTQALTGNNALQKEDGSYYPNESNPEAREFADQVNYGLFPGQYSTGALFNYKKIAQTTISQLRWKDFNPALNLSEFKDPKGNAFPEDMALFDKNLTDSLLEVEGKKLHLVLLHTTPAFNFGNPNSPNYQRNADQIRFLRWYLTGHLDEGYQAPQGIQPLSSNDAFVAMGDLNVDVTSDNPGASVLASLIKDTNSAFSSGEMTYASSNFSPKPFSLQLDYILFRGLKLQESKIYSPEQKRKELGCDASVLQTIRYTSDFVQVEYKNRGKTCYALVSKEYYIFKKASDHFPLFATFKF